MFIFKFENTYCRYFFMFFDGYFWLKLGWRDWMKGRKIILLLYIKFLGIDYLKEVGYGCK